MGNCIPIEKKAMENHIDVFFTSGSAGDKIRILISNEGGVVFFADSKPLVPVCMKMAPKSDLGNQKITFMLTKKQLAQLLYSNGVKEFGSVKELAFQVMENRQAREKWRKWRPSLATIPE